MPRQWPERDLEKGRREKKIKTGAIDPEVRTACVCVWIISVYVCNINVTRNATVAGAGFTVSNYALSTLGRPGIIIIAAAAVSVVGRRRRRRRPARDRERLQRCYYDDVRISPFSLFWFFLLLFLLCS